MAEGTLIWIGQAVGVLGISSCIYGGGSRLANIQMRRKEKGIDGSLPRITFIGFERSNERKKWTTLVAISSGCFSGYAVLRPVLRKKTFGDDSTSFKRRFSPTRIRDAGPRESTSLQLGNPLECSVVGLVVPVLRKYSIRFATCGAYHRFQDL